MKAFVWTMAVIQGLLALISLVELGREAPPRESRTSRRVTALSVVINGAISGWALWLLL